MTIKKSTQPFKQYIPVANNREFYALGNVLIDKDVFTVTPEEVEAIAHTKTPTDILVKITEFDITKNPSILLQTTSKKEVIQKVRERISNLDNLTRDVYLILFAHWIEYKDESGEAYIEIEDIHFNYRGLRGKNLGSTLADEDYRNYEQAIDILRNTSIKVEITNENNIAYNTLKNFNFGAIGGFLLEVSSIVYYQHDKSKIRGFKYNLSVIQDTFTVYQPKINYKYPTSLLQLTTKSETVKNLGHYLCYLHKSNEEEGEKSINVSFYVLMGESGFSIKGSRYQECINRFIIHLRKTEELLKKENIVDFIDIPVDIDAKNYKFKKVAIYWKYNNI